MAEEKYSLFNDLKIDVGQEPDNKDRFVFGQGLLTNPRAKYWDWELFKAWLDARIGSGGGGGDLTEVIVTTVAVGGVGVGVTLPIGMTTTELAKAVHAPYRPPYFTSFQINSNITGTLEVGQTITITNAMFGMGNDSEGNPPSDKHIIGAGFESATVVTTSPHAADAAVKTVVRNTAGSEAWVIQGLDKNNVLISSTVTRPWYHAFKFGASAVIVSDNASAKVVYDALQQSFLQAGVSRTVTCTEDNNNPLNKTYIIFDRSIAANLIDIKLNGVESVIGACTRIGEFSVANAQGVTSTKVVYSFNATGAFAIGQTLVIS
jgi:hypothetical protein